MFDKILIANRGEIAIRVMRTCQRLGVRTAIVYSDADADSWAVEMADEAIRIGPAPAIDSYLKIDAVVKAAQDVGAQAIHPGFGFLSENAAFADALDAAGIVFIGPNRHAIDAMGDKIRSKALAQKAGVNIVPGHVGEIDTAKDAAKIAAEIGYPVMIKASAGGGGKGMRIAWSDAEVEEGFSAARNEAKGSFGDERVFVEKFIERPRHIEIQVLGDKHGQIVHLGERECSIQRRNQKVIEEAPSPYLTPETRAAMGAQAVALAQAVNYDSAGTVEFIADQQQNFYFLEMNTRLQVEHPVTERITGLDLVEQMMRVAAGERLGVAQDDVSLKGWAIEARVYAEDPVRGFVPSIGRLNRWRPPALDEDLGAAGAAFRLDTGVREGDQVTPYYDPMLAKLIASGPDRATAVAGLIAALDRFDIAGPVSNVDFCARLMRIDAFGEGALHTGFIAEYGLEGPVTVDLTADERAKLAGVAVWVEALTAQRLAASRAEVAASARALQADWSVIIGEDVVPVTVSANEPASETANETTAEGVQRLTIAADTAVTLTSSWRPGDRVFEGMWNGAPLAVRVDRTGEGLALTLHGVTTTVIADSPERARLRRLIPEREDAAGALQVISPMPGLVRAVSVTAGQDVKPGDPLAVVEAMKMENIIRAERGGVLAQIAVAEGDSVSADQVLMVFEAPPST